MFAHQPITTCTHLNSHRDELCIERAAVDLGAGASRAPAEAVGAGEPDHLVARLEQLGDDGGTDPPGRAGHEDARGRAPVVICSAAAPGAIATPCLSATAA